MHPCLTGSVFGILHHFIFQWPYQKSVVQAIVAFLLTNTANALFEFKTFWQGKDANAIDFIIRISIFSLTYVRLRFCFLR
jgi:hypothetical protein